MKNKILFRLISYFVTSFIIFALIIGIIFTAIFSKNNLDIHEATLEERAVNVAHTLSEMLENSTNNISGQCSGYGSYLRYIEDISMNEVWVVDTDLNPLTSTCGQEKSTSLGNELPAWAAETVKVAIESKAMACDSFSNQGETQSLVTAMPIILKDGSVAGAVLLHSHVTDVDEATANGVMILVLSMSFAVVISVIVAVVLSSHFTKPLSKMKDAALKISAGDYTVKTGVKQFDEIGELAFAMDDMVDKLGEAAKEHTKLEKLRQDFTANISHELRTPVTVIRGSLEALRDGVVTDPEKVAQYHSSMLSESIYLERLVSDLLDLARLQNLDFAIELAEVNLKDIAEDVIRGMRRIAEQKQVTLAFSCVGEDFNVAGDYARLRQMFIIILDNAIKFSPQNERVDIVLSQSDTQTTVAISDKGSGVEPADLPYIFQRFYKLRSEENKTGTGLGLAIAKQIADRHNVEVDVKSQVGQGCQFTFIFNR